MGNEYYLQDPRKQFFYWIISTTASYLAVANRELWGFEKRSKLSIFNSFMVDICVPYCLICQVIYLYVYWNNLNFEVIGCMFVIVPVTTLVEVKVGSAKLSVYHKVIKDFMEKIHLYNYQNETEYPKKILIKAERFSRLTAFFLSAFLILDAILWSVIPIISNTRNSEAIHNKTAMLQTSLYMWMPFDYGYDYSNWVIVHSINVYFVCGGVTILFIYDVINYTIIYHLVGHIELLLHKIKTDFTEELEGDEVKDKLVSIVDYHSFVLRMFNNVETAFGLNVSANYLLNSIIDSLLLYLLMTGESYHKMPYCFLFLFFMGSLIFMSVILEEITRKSDGLPDAVYSLPWEKLSVKNQKMMVLILARVQPTLLFTAAGGLNAGVRPMIAIMKSTFSYYVMLKSTI